MVRAPPAHFSTPPPPYPPRPMSTRCPSSGYTEHLFGSSKASSLLYLWVLTQVLYLFPCAQNMLLPSPHPCLTATFSRKLVLGHRPLFVSLHPCCPCFVFTLLLCHRLFTCLSLPPQSVFYGLPFRLHPPGRPSPLLPAGLGWSGPFQPHTIVTPSFHITSHPPHPDASSPVIPSRIRQSDLSVNLSSATY